MILFPSIYRHALMRRSFLILFSPHYNGFLSAASSTRVDNERRTRLHSSIFHCSRFFFTTENLEMGARIKGRRYMMPDNSSVYNKQSYLSGLTSLHLSRTLLITRWCPVITKKFEHPIGFRYRSRSHAWSGSYCQRRARDLSRVLECSRIRADPGK